MKTILVLTLVLMPLVLQADVVGPPPDTTTTADTTTNADTTTKPSKPSTAVFMGVGTVAFVLIVALAARRRRAQAG